VQFDPGDAHTDESDDSGDPGEDGNEHGGVAGLTGVLELKGLTGPAYLLGGGQGLAYGLPSGVCFFHGNDARPTMAVAAERPFVTGVLRQVTKVPDADLVICDRLADLADAAGMSISGVRTAYDSDENAPVAQATGLTPSPGQPPANPRPEAPQ
jgi:hypothetical protein